MSAPTEPRFPAAANPSSRRTLLAGALGGVGAWAAGAIGRAAPVRAQGENVQVGGHYPTATSQTSIENTANSAPVFTARSHGAGVGVWGLSNTGVGVNGSSNTSNGTQGFSDTGYGVVGHSNSRAGVRGTSDSTRGVLGEGPIGVEGVSDNEFAWGVFGQNSAGGIGVGGAASGVDSVGVAGSTDVGRGVFGESSTLSGYAGYFAGRVFASKWYELSEVVTPAAPTSARRARLFIRDAGGKTQLCVRFHTGAVKVLATET